MLSQKATKIKKNKDKAKDLQKKLKGFDDTKLDLITALLHRLFNARKVVVYRTLVILKLQH